MSIPVGFNAGMYFGTAPWIAFTRTLTLVGTSATAIPSVPLTNRAGLWVFNSGTTNIYLGTSAVGTSNEFILFPNQTQLLPFSDAVIIYGRSASGSINCVSWEFLV